MKCLAAAVMYSKKETALSTEYGMWLLEWCDTVIGVALAEKHGFGFKRLQEFYDDTRRGLSETVGNYTPERIFVNKGRGREKGDSAYIMNDDVDTTVSVVLRQLGDIGLDTCRLDELIPIDNFDGKRRNEILCHAARKAWYELNGKRAILLYISYLMIYMNERHGFGKGRLNALMDEVNPKISRYLCNFLRGNISVDNEMKAELERMHCRLASRGIEFEEMPNEDTVQVRRKTSESVILMCSSKELYKFDEIMKEVKKQNLRRYD